jgi:hypothetical protein
MEKIQKISEICVHIYINSMIPTQNTLLKKDENSYLRLDFHSITNEYYFFSKIYIYATG